MSQTKDLRQYSYRQPRHQVEHTITIQGVAGCGAMVGQCFDVSETGLGVELGSELAVGTNVWVVLDLTPSGTPALRVRASVVHCHDGRCGLAFLFQSLEEEREVRHTISRIVSDSRNSGEQTESSGFCAAFHKASIQ